jgi:hypothetical protein
LVRRNPFKGLSVLWELFDERSVRSAEPVFVHALQRFGYAYTWGLLEAVVALEWLNPAYVQQVCDFGTGTGGPAMAVRDYFRLTSAQLQLLESDPTQVAFLKRIFPQAHIDAQDGLKWLQECLTKQDLICAFMLGPEYENEGFVAQFVDQALARLSDRGRLLIASDVATMCVVKALLARMPEVTARWLADSVWLETMPVTAVLSYTQVPASEVGGTAMRLPEPVIQSAMMPNAKGELALESYCLATPFEKAYLEATIAAFESQSPDHPAISEMKRLLDL